MIPGFFKTTLSQEYIATSQAFDFSQQDIQHLLLNAAQASFQTHLDKLALSNRLRTFFES